MKIISTFHPCPLFTVHPYDDVKIAVKLIRGLSVELWVREQF